MLYFQGISEKPTGGKNKSTLLLPTANKQNAATKKPCG